MKTLLIAETHVRLGHNTSTGNERHWSAADVNGDDLIEVKLSDYGVAAAESLVKAAEAEGKTVVRRTDGKPVFRLVHDLVRNKDSAGRIVITPLIAE